MTASNAESWARLRLVQGNSATKKWELTATQGNATLTIGTSADCTWVVREDGVRPVHFSLHWDGQQLRIADVYSAGDVRVDGVALTSQWRALDGRVRIEFGKAAMVVETAVGAPAEVNAPTNEPPADSKPSLPPRNAKGTLIGVVPTSAPTPVPSYLQAPEPKPIGVPPEPQREVRKGPPPGSLKATLVGGISVGIPSGSSPPPPAATGPRNKPNATLMGFSAVEALRGVVGTPSVPVGSSNPPSTPPGEITPGTVQGFPAMGAPPSTNPPPAGSSGPASSIPAGRRMTQKGVVSRPPGVLDGAVAHSPMRSVSSHPQAETQGGRIGAAWQEVPDGDAIVADSPAITGEERLPPPPRTARVSSSSWDIGERLSQLPTQMRDEAAFPTARRRRRPFPWRYVGVLLLTGVAYFAWLYLLDHW